MKTRDYLLLDSSNKNGTPIKIIPIVTETENVNNGVRYMGIITDKKPKKIMSNPPNIKIIFPAFTINILFLSYFYIITQVINLW
ncbi:MAG TPA: hypothetical protein VMY59_04655 [Candidatus Thermoplasmatota archaeon]|nr:hypothetical protein [Candidatus Thermoplasmatota archaeon]